MTARWRERSVMLEPPRGSDWVGGEQAGGAHAEQEAADVGEEGDAAAARAEQSEVALEELEREPAAEQEPRRDPDREHDHQREHAGARIQDVVRAEDGGDRPAGAELGVR